MNPTESELEKLLRQAPQPTPQESLKTALLGQIRLTSHEEATAETGARSGPSPGGPWSAAEPGPPKPARWLRSGRPWLNSWWPVVATASLAFACVVMLAVQRTQIARLRTAVKALEEQTNLRRPAATPAPTPARDSLSTSAPEDPRQEIERLRRAVKAAQAEVQRLETLAAAKQPTARSATFSPEELAWAEGSRAQADSTRCVNNLKQLGLAARVWAVDNNEILPPDLLSMSNELSNPLVLVCPSDSGRQPAASWATFGLANCSYEYLAASGTPTEPQRVAFRCPIHGHVALCDGSVQASLAKTHPEHLVMRDGKLWFVPLQSKTVETPSGPMPAEMARRYGLMPAQAPTKQAPPQPQP